MLLHASFRDQMKFPQYLKRWNWETSTETVEAATVSVSSRQPHRDPWFPTATAQGEHLAALAAARILADTWADPAATKWHLVGASGRVDPPARAKCPDSHSSSSETWPHPSAPRGSARDAGSRGRRLDGQARRSAAPRGAGAPGPRRWCVRRGVVRTRVPNHSWACLPRPNPAAGSGQTCRCRRRLFPFQDHRTSSGQVAAQPLPAESGRGHLALLAVLQDVAQPKMALERHFL